MVLGEESGTDKTRNSINNTRLLFFNKDMPLQIWLDQRHLILLPNQRQETSKSWVKFLLVEAKICFFYHYFDHFEVTQESLIVQESSFLRQFCNLADVSWMFSKA